MVYGTTGKGLIFSIHNEDLDLVLVLTETQLQGVGSHTHVTYCVVYIQKPPLTRIIGGKTLKFSFLYMHLTKLMPYISISQEVFAIFVTIQFTFTY